MPGAEHSTRVHQGLQHCSPVCWRLWRDPRVSDRHIRQAVNLTTELCSTSATKIFKMKCSSSFSVTHFHQDHSHLPGSPSIQRHTVRHPRGGADWWLCQVFSEGRQRAQPAETWLRGRTEMLCFPALGLPQDWGQPAGHWYARLGEHGESDILAREKMQVHNV